MITISEKDNAVIIVVENANTAEQQLVEQARKVQKGNWKEIKQDKKEHVNSWAKTGRLGSTQSKAPDNDGWVNIEDGQEVLPFA